MFAEFAKLRALRTFAHYVPLRLRALRALRTFGPYTPSALITFIPYTPSRLSTLLTRLIYVSCATFSSAFHALFVRLKML